MAEPTDIDPTRGAYRQGWSAGLALGALAVSAVAYLNLLSVEKSLLGIALAVLALRGAQGGARMQSWLAIGLAAIQIGLAVTVFVLFGDKLLELFRLLKTLG
jgi:hypothetical protein